MRSRYAVLLLVVCAIMAVLPAAAQEPYLGEIRFVGFNFAPTGWAQCNGQLLSIAENTALFSLLGTTFGGDGKTTFALPDMRGRVPLGIGQGTGLTARTLGETGGQEKVTLTIAEIPKHRHALAAASGSADSKAPKGDVLANSSTAAIYSTTAPTVDLAAASIGVQGGGQPHENMQPFLGMNCIIALQGIFPPRN
jgi:microcystin-dependent protein